MTTEAVIYDDHNLSGLGRELVAEIEVEIEYEYRRGYPATYMEPGVEDEVEVTSCQPVSIRLEPVEIPHSADSPLFIRLVNLFHPGPHKTQFIRPSQLDPARREMLELYCHDSKEIQEAAEQHARDYYDEYEDD